MKRATKTKNNNPEKTPFSSCAFIHRHKIILIKNYEPTTTITISL